MSTASLSDGCYSPDEHDICQNPQKNWDECYYIDRCPHYKKEDKKSSEEELKNGKG